MKALVLKVFEVGDASVGYYILDCLALAIHTEHFPHVGESLYVAGEMWSLRGKVIGIIRPMEIRNFADGKGLVDGDMSYIILETHVQSDPFKKQNLQYIERLKEQGWVSFPVETGMSPVLCNMIRDMSQDSCDYQNRDKNKKSPKDF